MMRRFHLLDDDGQVTHEGVVFTDGKVALRDVPGEALIVWDSFRAHDGTSTIEWVDR
jgi:hypothetical protein